ncbi:MAG: hypothetical protein LBH61_03055 [Dysgonamonadaceae bacterium]|jgi:hypothetical protein|nr:hypothetical protein [Dysgonamonadaceae bacterium]
MKTLFKYLFLTVFLATAFILVSYILPYFHIPQGANSEIFPSGWIAAAVNSAWICLIILYISKKTDKTNGGVMLRLSFSLFFIYAFLPLAEVLLYTHRFFVVTKTDVLWMMIAAGVPVVLAVLLGVWLFRNRFTPSRYSRSQKSYTTGKWTAKLFFSGLLYLIIYYAVNHFFAWQLEEIRVFYTGRAERAGLVPRLLEIWQTQPSVFLFQFAKGVAFGIFILPVVDLFKNRPAALQTAVILIFETAALHLTIQGVLLPTGIRTVHLLETAATLLLFAIAAGKLFKETKGNDSNYKYY